MADGRSGDALAAVGVRMASAVARQRTAAHCDEPATVEWEENHEVARPRESKFRNALGIVSRRSPSTTGAGARTTSSQAACTGRADAAHGALGVAQHLLLIKLEWRVGAECNRGEELLLGLRGVALERTHLHASAMKQTSETCVRHAWAHSARLPARCVRAPTHREACDRIEPLAFTRRCSLMPPRTGSS
eukprot:scaffold138340_cov28-Tisochrysis_lutea.AAC.6